MRLEALVFDAYGTLYDVHSVLERCESFFAGQGAQLSRLWRAKQLEYTWLRSLMGRYVPFSTVTREALACACETLGLELTAERMEALMGEYNMLSTYPEVPAALARLSTRRQAVLSNGSPDMLLPLVKHSGLKFDAVLSVDEVGTYKPAPQVYELAVSRLGVAKERIGFVSSNCWDALGAKSYGFAVFWINRTASPVDRLGFKPDRMVRGLDEILLP
jgi:2-haloacid dehalogenase